MSIGWSLFGVVVLIVAWVWFDRPRHTRTEEKNRKVIEQELRHIQKRFRARWTYTYQARKLGIDRQLGLVGKFRRSLGF